MTRGLISGLLGFTLAGIVLAAVFSRVLPDAWSPGAFAAVGIAAAVIAGAAGGLAAVMLDPPAPRGAAILGPLLGAVLLIALQPQADLVTLFSLLAVLAGAAATAVAFSARSRGRRRLG
jgi:hypothetical protein